MHSNSFESPDTGGDRFSLRKEFESTFRVFFLHSKNPRFNSVYLVRVPFLNSIAVCLKCFPIIYNLLQISLGKLVKKANNEKQIIWGAVFIV